jgi:hypothetical protein
MVIARYVLAWAFCLFAVYVLVTTGPALWQHASQTVHDAPQRVSEYRLRFAEVRILLTIMNVIDAKNALFQQDFQLMDGMKTDDRARILNASFNGCKGVYGNDETSCLTIMELAAERKRLDVLRQRLFLILTSADPEKATLPSDAEKYTPSLWKVVRHTVTPGKENIKEALPTIRAFREIQKPPGTKVSRRLLIGACEPQSPTNCSEGILAEARKKGLIVLDDTEANGSDVSPTR